MQEQSFTLLQKPLDPKQTPKNIWRRFILLWPFLIALISISFYFLYLIYTHNLETRILRQEDGFIQTSTQLLQKEIQQQIMILQMTSKSAIIPAFFSSTSEEEKAQHKQKISSLFINLSNTFQSHDQIRLINLDGKEIVKTLYNPEFEQSISSNDLQDISQSHYFKAARSLNPNEAYISQMELSLYKGEIETPPKPILRFATPILNEQGNKVAILMINYLAQDFLNSLQNKHNSNITSYPMLIDMQGFWLSHYNSNQEWGRDLDQPDNNIQAEFPEAWAQIQQQEKGTVHTDKGLFSFQSIEPFNQEDLHYFPAVKKLSMTSDSINNAHWKLVLFIPNEIIHRASFFTQPIGISILIGTFSLISILLFLFISLYEQKKYQNEYTKRMTSELTDLYENAPCGYNTIDKRGYIKRVNHTLTEWLGYPKSEVLNRHFSEFLTEHSKILFNKLIEDLEIKHHVEGVTLELLNKEGERFYVSLSAAGIKDRNRLVVARTTVFNISDRIKLEQELKMLANTDPLTGIRNRRSFFEQAIALFPPHVPNNQLVAVMMFDIDHFKSINDTYGHDAGDLVLKEFADTLSKNIDKDMILARLGGEEFSILCSLSSPQKTIEKAETLRQIIEELSIKINGFKPISMTVSIGCSHQVVHKTDIDQLMNQADTALYQAKLSGRNQVALFQPDLSE